MLRHRILSTLLVSAGSVSAFLSAYVVALDLMTTAGWLA